MIDYKKEILENGLKVLIHKDASTPMVAVNILYDVGSRDENQEKTGFAHLFEHLMFGGSKNVIDFDVPIQMAGGESNAFTNSDITNFYEIVPAPNLDTVLWLESDRMKQLDFSQKLLDIQKNVVIEEFKETSLNQPYGDVWHRLTAMAYTKHSYRWPTIGLVPEHIENATLEDVKSFFFKHYRPNNAILVVAGNIEFDEVMIKIREWFGSIPPGENKIRDLQIDAPLTAKKQEIIRSNVPSDSIYLAWQMPGRDHEDFYACDLLSDVLGNGQSSRLYQNLSHKEQIFSQIDAYISGSLDPGLFIIEGKPFEGVDYETAIQAILKELKHIQSKEITQEELEKLKNKVESSLTYSEVSVLNKAINLAFYELLGDATLINKQAELYQKVSLADLQRVAKDIFRDEYCELVYLKEVIDEKSKIISAMPS